MMKSFACPSSQPGNAAIKKPASSKKRTGKPEDAQEVAGFLLSLKNQRSVSPDPNEPQVPPQHPMLPYGLHVMPTPYVAHPAFSYPYTAEHPVPQQPSPKQKFHVTPKDKKRSLTKAPVTNDFSTSDNIEEFKEYNFEELLEDSLLVQMKDRDLVPDSLFLAMSQMKTCDLTQADRVGCYKARDLGFVGMCCKHCGGQPGFGRYFPNSVRSLAQTTTSQTILKHIGSKCRFCPTEIRDAVLDLQRQQAAREGSASGRPRYGSRKIFFQRVWSRLHGANAKAADDEDCSGSKSDETASLEEERSTFSGSNNADARESSEEKADSVDSKRKDQYGALPITTTKSNKRLKISEVVLHNVKAD
jgi:hypothetical protein